MSDAVESPRSGIWGEGSHFSPGHEVLEDVSADATLDTLQEAYGRSRPDSLAFILSPLTGDVDTCFSDADEASDTLDAVRAASLRSRFARSRLTHHGRMIRALPIFAGELAGHCETDGLAIRSLIVQFFYP